MLLQASREARSYRAFQKFSLEMENTYDIIFTMEITHAERHIAVNNFVNWAVDYSQLCGNSVGLNKIISQLNTGIKKIGELIGLNASTNRGNGSELLALRAKARRAQAALLHKRMASGQTAKNEITNIRKDALADAQRAYELNDGATAKHELALCLFANSSTHDSSNAMRALELLQFAYKEGSCLAAYELAKQLRVRHREEDAIVVFKSVAEIDDDRQRFHSNVSLFASAVIGVYYKDKRKEKYIEDALLACQYLEEVISYEHHTALEIVDYTQLKLICGSSVADTFKLIESLKPMSTTAWDELAEIGRKVSSGDDSVGEALLLGLEDASIWNRIGTLHSDFNSEFHKAIEFYDRAILFDKKCPIYHYNKARTLALKLHDYSSAQTSLSVAHSLRRFCWAWYKEHQRAFIDLKAEIENRLDRVQ
jgi:tetratricopeptide (TPR) repeat protein